MKILIYSKKKTKQKWKKEEDFNEEKVPKTKHFAFNAERRIAGV